MQESEGLSRAVLNSMMANIAVVDRNGTIIAINDGWARFAQENGCDPSSPKVGVGANYLDVCALSVRDLGAEGQEILDGIKGVLAHSQSTFRHEYPCHSPTEQRWFAMLVSPLNREAGGAVIAQFNITEHKRAEETLFRSQEMLQIVLDNIPAGVFWKDRNLIYLGCNSSSAHAVGLSSPDEIIGKSDFDLASKEMAEAYRADDRAVMESRIPKIDFEEALPQPDGSIGTIITNKLPLHDREGNVLGMMGTFEDITERKRKGEELAARTSELAVAVDSLKAEISERERLEIEVLKISDHEQARIGRDLHDGACQDMAAIGFLAEVVSLELGDEKSQSAANLLRISELSRKSTDKVRRLASGLFPVAISQQGLGVALQDLAAESSATSDVRCVFIMPGPITFTDADAAVQLYRIAQAAVSNALRHSGARNVTIELTEHGGTVRLAIKDDGAGLPLQPKKGGLGLHTMRYRARALGGSLEVGPTAERGTAVVCTFPGKEFTDAKEHNCS